MYSPESRRAAEPLGCAVVCAVGCGWAKGGVLGRVVGRGETPIEAITAAADGIEAGALEPKAPGP